MKKLQFTLALIVASASLLSAQVVTAPVGFVSVTVPTASDAALGAPLGRAEEFQGVIQSISGNTLTVAGTPAWTANQFVYVAGTQRKTYFARIDTGAKEGLIATITANGSGDLAVALPAGENLSNVSTNAALVSPATTGDSISIAPYWTIGTLFSGAIPGTQILVTPTTTPGINIAAQTHTFNGTNWVKGVNVSNDTVLEFGQGLILRNNSNSTALNISITGTVPMSGHRLVLSTLAGNTKQDYRIFYNSPIPELIGNVFNAGSLVAGDQLLHTDNVPTGKNKPMTTLTWNGSNWIQGASVVTTTFSLQPGSSYLFRKNKSTNPSSVVWSDLQSYLQ